MDQKPQKREFCSWHFNIHVIHGTDGHLLEIGTVLRTIEVDDGL